VAKYEEKARVRDTTSTSSRKKKKGAGADEQLADTKSLSRVLKLSGLLYTREQSWSIVEGEGGKIIWGTVQAERAPWTKRKERESNRVGNSSSRGIENRRSTFLDTKDGERANEMADRKKGQKIVTNQKEEKHVRKRT